MHAVLSAATNWILFSALVVGLGAVAARWIMIPRVALSVPHAVPVLEQAAAKLARSATLALTSSLALVLLRQLLEFRDPFATWAEDAGLLLGTEWGTTWKVAFGTSLLAVATVRAARPGQVGAWALGSLSLLALAGYPALSGHAAGTESLAPLTIGADVAHVLAAGVWVGGLLFVLAGDRAWATTSGTSALPALVAVFSPLAIVSVTTLVGTGLVASWVHVGSFGALVTTTYGRILCAKVALVLGVMTLGAVNWRRLTPRLGEEAGEDALRASAARELALAHLVLLVTAVLVRTSPMAH